MMEDQSLTLERLKKLQTNFSLPKEEVLRRVKTYLQTLGRKIGHIISENSAASNPDRMATRLWNYVSTYSNLKGDKLAEIYKKLRQEPAPSEREHAVRGSSQDPNHSGVAAGPSGRDDHSHFNSNKRQFNQIGNINAAQVGEPSRGDAESWKRRQRDSMDPSAGSGPGHNRNKWEASSGRPGSADGWRNSNNSRAGSPPTAQNGSGGAGGWGHDVKDSREDSSRAPWGPHDHRNPRDWNPRRDEVNRNPRPHPRPAGGPSSYGHAPPTFTR